MKAKDSELEIRIENILARRLAQKDSEIRGYSIYKNPAKVMALEQIIKEWGLYETKIGEEFLNTVKRLEKAKFISRFFDTLERLAAITSTEKFPSKKKLNEVRL